MRVEHTASLFQAAVLVATNGQAEARHHAKPGAVVLQGDNVGQWHENNQQQTQWTI
jgi:hypothetical protein